MRIISHFNLVKASISKKNGLCADFFQVHGTMLKKIEESSYCQYGSLARLEILKIITVGSTA